MITPYSFGVVSNASFTHPIDFRNSTPLLPNNVSNFEKSFDTVFSSRFVDFINADAENPCVTSVGKLFDRCISFFWRGSKEKNTFASRKKEVLKRTRKREISHIEETSTSGTDYRRGLYFINWPPFTFKEPDGSFWPPCKSVWFEIPRAENSSLSDVLAMNLNIGTGNCLLYESQAILIETFLGPFFDRKGKYKNATLLFEKERGNSDDEGILKLPSRILPQNWSIHYLCDRKVSKSFLKEIFSALTNLTVEEGKKYRYQTDNVILSSTLVGFFVCSGLALKYFFGKKDETPDELLEVIDSSS